MLQIGNTRNTYVYIEHTTEYTLLNLTYAKKLFRYSYIMISFQLRVICTIYRPDSQTCRDVDARLCARLVRHFDAAVQSSNAARVIEAYGRVRTNLDSS